MNNIASTTDPCLRLVGKDDDSDEESSFLQVHEEGSLEFELTVAEQKLHDKNDCDGAMDDATKVLNAVPPLPTIAYAARLRGRAVIEKAIQAWDKTGKLPSSESWQEAWNAFQLSHRLSPDCEETLKEIAKISLFLKKLPTPEPPPKVAHADVDVLIVGAGPAGIGTALMLTNTFGLEKHRIQIVERGAHVGESFRRWPQEMRFISPSFNQQGWTQSFDLNAISYGTSPAYLAAFIHNFQLQKQLELQTEVIGLQPVGSKQLPLFEAQMVTKKNPGKEPIRKTITARYVVWAAGEFQYPRKDGFEGVELCQHNSTVKSWAKLPGDDFVVIGGYESGCDASFHLAKQGKNCTLLASTPCWSDKSADPSIELAPYTAARIREVTEANFEPKPQLIGPVKVTEVGKTDDGRFYVKAKWMAKEKDTNVYSMASLRATIPDEEAPGEEGSETIFHTSNPPILCTGFEGSVAAAARHLFAFGDTGTCLGNAPLLTHQDESTKVPGVFLVGPSVQQNSLTLCFIYKFRQRFAIVANAICQGLGRDNKAAVAECLKQSMYLDNLAACEKHMCGDDCAKPKKASMEEEKGQADEHQVAEHETWAEIEKQLLQEEVNLLVTEFEKEEGTVGRKDPRGLKNKDAAVPVDEGKLSEEIDFDYI